MWYDVIIVGAGSAGAVIASRLTEGQSMNVLLIEAGRDYSTVSETPAEILDGSRPVISGHNWPIEAIIHEQHGVASAARAGKVFAVASNRSSMIKAAVASRLHGSNPFRTFHYPVGKLVGGTSAVNGGLAMRALPEDFDEWVVQGNELWSWSGVEEYYKRIEYSADTNVTNSKEHRVGIPISHISPEQFTPLQRDFFEICKTMGFSERPVTDPGSGGIGGVSRNVQCNRRISTALGYLCTARKRRNLTLLANTLTDKVIFDGDRAVGVQVLIDGRERRLFAKEVVVCAGSLQTPCILLRSGIGSVPALERLGIKVVAERPGVGRNLADHPAVALWAIPAQGACQPREEMHQAILQFSAEGSEVRNDMQLFMLSAVDTSLFPELKAALGVEQAVALSVVVAKPFSTGAVSISSTRPEQQPQVILNCATDRRDIDRLMQGIRLAWEILHRQPLRGKITKFFAWNDRILRSDSLLKEMISTFVRGSWHAVGTAKMGPERDDLAVVDQYGRVYGCRNLRIADASIMPTIIRSPTNLTTLMIAERIADHISAAGAT